MQHIKSFIHELRETHHTITMAVFRNFGHIETSPEIEEVHLRSGGLLTAYVSRSGPEVLETAIKNSGYQPAFWVELRVYDRLLPEFRIQDGSDMPSTFVRVGMLDKQYGFIAVRANGYETVVNVNERVQLSIDDICIVRDAMLGT